MSLEFALSIRNDIANTKFFNNEDFTIKAFSDVVNTSGAGTEITAAGYAAIEVTNDLTNFPTATIGTRSNAVILETAEFTEDASITSIGIYKTSDDTFLARKVYDTPLEVSIGQKWRFPVGAFYFTPTNPS